MTNLYAWALAIDPTNTRTLIAAGYGTVMISTDEAETWSAFDSTGLGPFWMSDVLFHPSDGNTLIAATSCGVYSYTRKPVAPEAPLIERISPSSGKVGDSITIIGQRFGAIRTWHWQNPSRRPS
ncbi:MAG: hypothetical protein AB1714_22255 [Acidobacteriota bacterium]